MGKITGYNQNDFKSAEYIYSKIKREFKSFGGSNLLDDNDFPLYTAEVLKTMGISSYKEEDAILKVKNGKAKLPCDFMQIYAAYKCGGYTVNRGDKHFQNKSVFENDITCEILGRRTNCEINCNCPDKVISRITVKQYVNDNCIDHEYNHVHLLSLSPNVKEHCSDDCLNFKVSCKDEISISNGYLITNFAECDIYLQYYAFPQDENGLPMIPSIIQAEKAIEWYIKWQVLLNYWLVDDVANVLSKWQKAEEQYEKDLAEYRYISKLPSFSQMLNTIKNKRSINSVSFFSQIDRR